MLSRYLNFFSATRYRVGILLLAAVVVFLSGNPSFAFDFGSASMDVSTEHSIDRSVQTVVRSKGEAIEATLQKTQLKFTNLLSRPKNIVSTADNSVLVSVYDKGTMRVWNFRNGEQTLIEARLSRKDDVFVLLPGGLKGLIFDSNGEVILLDLLLSERISLGNYDRQVLAKASFDSQRIVSANAEGQVTMWDLSHIDLLRGIKFVDKSHRILSRKVELPSVGAISSFGFSPDDRFFAVADEKGGTSVLSTADDSLVYKVEADNAQVDLLLQGDSENSLTLAGVDKNGKVSLWDVKNKRLYWEKKFFSAKATSLETDDDNTFMALSSASGDVVLIELRSGRKVQSLKIDDTEVVKAWPLQKGRMIFSLCIEGKIRIHDVETREVVLTGVSTKSGWVVVDTQGRFDGSDNALDDARWLVKDLSLSLDSFTKAYYEPGLLTKYMLENIPFSSRGLFNVSRGIPLPPTIQKLDFLASDKSVGKPTQIIIAAKDIGGKVEDIELFHNGKRLPASSVIVNKEQGQGSEASVRAMVYQVIPVPGKNSFRAVGVGLGGIEGPAKELTETFYGADVASELHVLSVGIDQYLQNNLNLSYATADATAIAKRLQENGGIFSNVKTYEIFDAKATKQGIVSALRHVALEAKASDTLVVYFAGHGVIEGEEWFFLPHDVAGTSPAQIRRSGIDAALIREILLEAPAQKIFLLIDSCYAGQAVTLFDQFLLRRLHRLMGRSSGVGVFTAARSDQEAAESKVLGHGLFTAALLKGIDGEADAIHKDLKVSAKELMDYSQKLIPVYSRDYLNIIQTPVSFFGGNDFPVSSYQ